MLYMKHVELVVWKKVAVIICLLLLNTDTAPEFKITSISNFLSVDTSQIYGKIVTPRAHFYI